MAEFIESGHNQEILECVLALGVVGTDSFLASGTAFIVAPALVVTAKHVVEDYLDQFADQKTLRELGQPKENISVDDFHIAAVQYRRNGEEHHVFRVYEIYYCLQSDIVFLYLTPFNEAAKNHVWNFCRLNLIPPEPGDEIIGFGFHSSDIKLIKGESGSLLDWKDKTATTIGKVATIFTQKRDEFRLNFPCFQTDARFDGGMSGGPVLNTAGEVCGVICSSLPADAEYPEHTSYAALLWPAMVTQIKVPYPEMIGSIPYAALDLAKAGIIDATGWEKITLLGFSDKGWYEGVGLSL